AKRGIGGEKVEPGDAGGLDQLLRIDVFGEDRLGVVPAVERAAEQEARRRLRIEVPQKSPPRRAHGRGPGEADREGRLTDPALQAVNRDRAHALLPRRRPYRISRTLSCGRHRRAPLPVSTKGRSIRIGLRTIASRISSSLAPRSTSACASASFIRSPSRAALPARS